MDYIKVKDKDHLARDINSNGIVNFDVDGYNQYAENYKRVYNESQKIKNLENEVSEIKSDLNEIKTLLRNFVNESK
jgi:acyl-[acyl carrier protein]--UDP-N-acetylglucosamine O-acyltransferase